MMMALTPPDTGEAIERLSRKLERKGGKTGKTQGSGGATRGWGAREAREPLEA